MRSKCKIELLDFDQPPPGFEILSRTAHGRELFRYRYQLIPGEECERREQAVALAWNRYTRFHWPPGRVVNASLANARVRSVRVLAAAWAWYRRRAELAKRLDAAVLKSIADNWQVGEDDDDTIPSVWPRCLRWSDRRVGEEERRLALEHDPPNMLVTHPFGRANGVEYQAFPDSRFIAPTRRDAVGQPISPDGMYLVQDTRRVAIGLDGRPRPYWWLPEIRGYTVNIAKAGEYSGTEVAAMRLTDLAWPAAAVREAVALGHELEQLRGSKERQNDA